MGKLMARWAQKLKNVVMGPSQKEEKESGIDRRKFERILIPFWGHVRLEAGEAKGTGYVKNISKGGIFVESKQMYPYQSEVKFEFYLPKSNHRISGMAKVAWVREEWGDAAQPPGIGLEFSHFDGQSERFFMEFIKSHLPTAKRV